MSPEQRDEVVTFIDHWCKRTGLSVRFFLNTLKLLPGRFYAWRRRHKQPNKHNSDVPKRHWLLEDEKQAIIDYAIRTPGVGYRRLTYMMLDENIVAVSPSSVYRILLKENLLQEWDRKASQKGTGFTQPTKPHEHWHIDISYINVSGTFYYLFTILDGYSRYIVDWRLGEQMTEADVEVAIQSASEKFTDAKPRIISDNGPQFIAKDFKSYLRLKEMTHVTTSPYYPQSNGKLERYHRSIKSECIRERNLLDKDDAIARIKKYVNHYNNERLHSAIGYIKPVDKLNGRADQIKVDRQLKLEEARARRLEVYNKLKAQTTVESPVQ